LIGCQAVRDIFAAARQTGRSTLLFFDEFESLAAKRGVLLSFKIFAYMMMVQHYFRKGQYRSDR